MMPKLCGAVTPGLLPEGDPKGDTDAGASWLAYPEFLIAGLLRRRKHPSWLRYALSASSTYCTSTTAGASVASLARTALAAPRYDKR